MIRDGATLEVAAVIQDGATLEVAAVIPVGATLEVLSVVLTCREAVVEAIAIVAGAGG